MQIVLFEDAGVYGFLPLVYWRSVFELRCGRLTLSERILAKFRGTLLSVWVREWMADVAAERLGVPANAAIGDVSARRDDASTGPTRRDDASTATTLLVNGRWIPDGDLDAIASPAVGICGGQIAYIRCDGKIAAALTPAIMWTDPWPHIQHLPQVPAGGRMFDHPWDLVHANGELLQDDWRAGEAAIEGCIDEGAILLNRANIRVGKNSRVKPTAVLDASDGPIFIGNGVTISPHCCVTGPAFIGDGSTINPGASIRGQTSIGPVCKIGGEIEGTIIHGFSNKQHDGFLGHAYVGSWVNLGADTVNSDLKNTYGSVRVSIAGCEIDTGQTFVGAFIGDHAKTGIRQALPTGMTLGFASSAAASRILPKFVPSFRWMTDDVDEQADPARCLAVAKKMMLRRNVAMTPAEEELFLALPEIARKLETIPD